MSVIQEIKKLLENFNLENQEILAEILSVEENMRKLLENWSHFSSDEKIQLCTIFERVESLPIEVADLAKEEEDLKVKASLVKSLYRVKDETVIEKLAEFLKHEDRRVRANAVEALGIIHSHKVKELLLPYLDDPDNRVRANTAVALWKYPEIREEVKKTFEEMLKDSNKWMKASAFYAFGEIGIREFLEQLMQDLYNHDEDLAKNAFLALISYSEKYSE